MRKQSPHDHPPYTKPPCDSRVAVFIPSLGGGGAERAMLLFAKGLIEERFNKVDVVVANASGQLLSEVPKPLRLIDLKQKRVSRTLFPLVRYLCTARPEALYSSIAHANVIAVFAKILARVPTKVIVRESNSPLTSPADSFAARIVLRLVPQAYARADAVIAVSDGVKRELLQLAPALKSKVRVLPTPVVPDDLARLCHAETTHPWLSDRSPRFVLAVGRLHPQKDFPTLIHAFAKVREREPLRLIILGEGPERSRLEGLVQELGIAEHVSLPGFQPNPYPFFANAALFVLSSRYEGMPNVLIQALACGTPVIATDCPSGPREVLAESGWGRLVPVGDVQALAHAITASLLTPPSLEAPEQMRRRFGVRGSAQAYLAVAGLGGHETGGGAKEVHEHISAPVDGG